MAQNVIRTLQTLELEEKILNAALAGGLIGVFLPWISGDWLGEDTVLHSGFGFFTGLIGCAVFLLLATPLAVTVVPLFGGSALVKKRHRDLMRFVCSAQATVLVLACLSVLQNVTFQFSRLEVRFGIYITLIGCLVSTLYSFMRFQEFRKQQAQGIFHHPETAELPHEKSDLFTAPPPPPPPPAPAAEDHRILPQ